MNKIPDKNKCCIGEKNECCIHVFDMCVEFENTLALDNVSFSISQGVLTGVVGPNGGGKSTLFNALVGLQEIPCLLYTSPSPRDATLSRMPSSA